MSATIAMAPVRKSIRVKAAQERAFEIFTQWRWWPKEHSILKSKSPQVSVTTEPRVGGRWFERGEIDLAIITHVESRGQGEPAGALAQGKNRLGANAAGEHCSERNNDPRAKEDSSDGGPRQR